jgi:hypothetical protein
VAGDETTMSPCPSQGYMSRGEFRGGGGGSRPRVGEPTAGWHRNWRTA